MNYKYAFSLRLLFTIITLFSLFLSPVHATPKGAIPLEQQSPPEGFVYLSDIDPSIITSVRYATQDNFVGCPITGYNKEVVIMTREAALQLKKVQERVKEDGYSLVVYDAYRPQKAVDHFMQWSGDSQDQVCKDCFYPRVDKKDVFDLGYVAAKSGHSRGSTVDLTLIHLGQALHAIQASTRTMSNGYTLPFLDDGTVDMGSSFDLFDQASHYENDLIDSEYQERRTYLKEIMDEYGFKNYAEEWWHFTLRDEPFPDTYFNFDVK